MFTKLLNFKVLMNVGITAGTKYPLIRVVILAGHHSCTSGGYTDFSVSLAESEGKEIGYIELIRILINRRDNNLTGT